MSASLVGSEMCIRDSALGGRSGAQNGRFSLRLSGDLHILVIDACFRAKRTSESTEVRIES
eukprot:5688946-Alexandrium_andersonii.AAC.1